MDDPSNSLSIYPTVVEYNTNAIASFNTDSPNTRAYKLASTPSCLNIANTVTGSVAEINAPKLYHQI